MRFPRKALSCLVAFLLCGVPAAAGELHSEVVQKNPADYTPQLVPTLAVPLPYADAIGQVGNSIFVGGQFDSVVQAGSIESEARQNFVSFDIPSGQLKNGVGGFVEPVFNGKIRAITTWGNSLFVGGEFSTVNGISRNRLVKIDATTGAVDLAFNANFTGGILFDLEMWNGFDSYTPTLIVAGTMGKKLIALNPSTGANTGYFNWTFADPLPNAWGGIAVYSIAVNPAGTKLVGTGNFQTVRGEPRSRLFVADLTQSSGLVDPWYYPGFAKSCSSTHPRRIAYLQGVDFSPDGSYFVVTATGQIPLVRPDDIWPDGAATYHTVCDATARFNIDDDQHPVWINYTGGDSVWSAVSTGVAVYTQGHFKWLDNPFGFSSLNGGGAVPRYGIGAIDPNTGRALEWNPFKGAAAGGKNFLTTPSGLWVVSDSLKFANEFHRGIAFAPLP